VSTLWKVFIDDSADAERKKYVLAGALVGRKQAWHDFEKQWNRTLRNKPKIAYFHGKEISDLSGEFAQFKDKDKWPKPTGSIAANSKRDALRKVLEESKLVAIGVGVMVGDYNKVKAAHPLGATHMASDVYEWTLQHTLMQTAAAIRKADDAARIAFVSDDSSRATRYTEVYTNFKVKNPKIAKHMLGIAHLDDKAWPGLQAADMVASAVKRVYDDQHRSGEVDPTTPLLSGFYRIGMVDEGYLLEIMNGQSEMRSDDDWEYDDVRSSDEEDPKRL